MRVTSALKANGMIGRKEVAGIAQMPSVQDAPLVLFACLTNTTVLALLVLKYLLY